MVDEMKAERSTAFAWASVEPVASRQTSAAFYDRYELWNNGPKKWWALHGAGRKASQHHHAMVCALIEAAQWLDTLRREIAADILARPVRGNARIYQTRAHRHVPLQHHNATRQLPDFNVFFRYGANFRGYPMGCGSSAKMYRWGHLTARATWKRSRAWFTAGPFRRAARNWALRADRISNARACIWPWRLGDIVLGATCSLTDGASIPRNPLPIWKASGPQSETSAQPNRSSKKRCSCMIYSRSAGRSSGPRIIGQTKTGRGWQRMSACRAIEEVLKRDSDVYQITVIGAENRVNYNRIMLSPVLAGEKSFEDIVINDEAWYRERHCAAHG